VTRRHVKTLGKLGLAAAGGVQKWKDFCPLAGFEVPRRAELGSVFERQLAGGRCARFAL
jgi:hypothetical protein